MRERGWRRLMILKTRNEGQTFPKAIGMSTDACPFLLSKRIEAGADPKLVRPGIEGFGRIERADPFARVEGAGVVGAAHFAGRMVDRPPMETGRTEEVHDLLG